MTAITPALLLLAVKLAPYPQKIVTRYANASEPAVPASVRQGTSKQATTRDGATWKALDEHGLIREDQRARPAIDRLQYFTGLRYLAGPTDTVAHIAPATGHSGVWVRTESGGITEIALRPMTLAQKAEHFEQRVAARHDRLGFVSSSHFDKPGDPASNRLDPSDNDGLWTAMYAAAECFRYAVTKTPDSLDRARRATEAVLKLEEVTRRPGYPARSYIRKGDWRGAGGTWHWSPDGEIEWKADTSSDEIVGHFYIFALAFDLLPDAAFKQRIAATCRRVMDHILERGYNLTDVHGNPTYWGRWSPAYFATDRGRPDSPLNALELLSFLLVTHHITGDGRYLAEYRKVAVDLRYLDIARQLPQLRQQINYSDEELAMLPFYLVFRYEKDPARLRAYREALEHWWANIRRERNPLWTFIYQTAHPDKQLDLDEAVHTLYRFPIDMISWRVDNSWRTDIQWSDKADRFGRREALTWLPPDERPVMKWNGNPFVVNGGDDGRGEDDGATFLLPYWMGRYHRFLIGE